MWSIQLYFKTNFIGMRWLSSWMDSWFCCNKFVRSDKPCVMAELLQYSGTLLKPGASIAFSKMHEKLSVILFYTMTFGVSHMWQALERPGQIMSPTKCGRNSILLAIQSGWFLGDWQIKRVRDLNESVNHRKDPIQYKALNKKLEKIFGGGVF